MYKALIIDDEKPVRTVITTLGKWHSLGIEPPLTAFNGQEGLSIMREVKTDIVFVDMQMPILNGTQFLSLASKEFPDSKYIVVSGYNHFQYAQSAIKNGAIDYLLKPVVAEELNNALKKAVTSLNAGRNLNIGETLQTESIPPEDIQPDQVVDIIKEYIEQNYCRDIHISMFSEKYYFSKEYLSKLFKRKYNCGIYEYALNLRMKRAADLLAAGELQIQEISERLGYSNNNYFSKAFKNYYDFSPTEYREKASPFK